MREFLYKTRDGMDLCAYAWEAEGPWADLCLIHGLGEHAGEGLQEAGVLQPRRSQ